MNNLDLCVQIHVYLLFKKREEDNKMHTFQAMHVDLIFLKFWVSASTYSPVQFAASQSVIFQRLCFFLYLRCVVGVLILSFFQYFR